MALIKCPECGKEISSLAKVCPNCGCPSEIMTTGGTVKIKMPLINLGCIAVFSTSPRSAIVKTSDGKILWEGHHGETAVFEIPEPMDITIDLGIGAHPFSGKVEPNKRYNCVPDLGFHLVKVVFYLTEVDII